MIFDQTVFILQLLTKCQERTRPAKEEMGTGKMLLTSIHRWHRLFRLGSLTSHPWIRNRDIQIMYVRIVNCYLKIIIPLRLSASVGEKKGKWGQAKCY